MATAHIEEPVGLDALSRLPEVSYDPLKYRCAYFKDTTMRAKVSIFPSGKMIVVGAKTEESAKDELLHVIRVLNREGFTSSSGAEVTVQNVVATVDLARPIDLEDLLARVPSAVYEPEQFPAAVVRPKCCEVSVLVFGSGKLVFAGLKSAASVPKSVKNVLGELELPGGEP